MKPWELKEAELLKQENAYLEKYNWFEKIIDNHLYFCLFFMNILLVSFLIGLLIGMAL